MRNQRKFYKVLIYCPDRHIQYDGRSPARDGIGGGITARIRMSHALARGGHSVTHVGNCVKKEVYQSVHYIPIDLFDYSFHDIVILTTSGDGLNLSQIHNLKIEASKVILWIHGVYEPVGLDGLDVDTLYLPSKYVMDFVRKNWESSYDRILVTPNGFDPTAYSDEESITRDSYRLIYASHPSKGLASALSILKLLRRIDKRFHLDIYGGHELWGRAGSIGDLPEGAFFHGMIGQNQLANELQGSGFSINLQKRQEPFGLVVLESMRAGCIPICSLVGAYPELVADKVNGLIYPGDPSSSMTHLKIVKDILQLLESEQTIDAMRTAAKSTPQSVDEIAEEWERDWVHHSTGKPTVGSA